MALTEDAKLKWLQEHLAYERDMLAYAYERLSAPAGVELNVMIEVFWLHARNLYDFLKSKGEGNNVKANQYVKDYKLSSNFNMPKELGVFFFHNGERRLDWEKVNASKARDFAVWFDKHWPRWAAQLAPPFKGRVDVQPISQLYAVTFGAAGATTTPSSAMSKLVIISSDEPPSEYAFDTQARPSGVGKDRPKRRS